MWWQGEGGCPFRRPEANPELKTPKASASHSPWRREAHAFRLTTAFLHACRGRLLGCERHSPPIPISGIPKSARRTGVGIGASPVQLRGAAGRVTVAAASVCGPGRGASPVAAASVYQRTKSAAQKPIPAGTRGGWVDYASRASLEVHWAAQEKLARGVFRWQHASVTTHGGWGGWWWGGSRGVRR